VAPVVAPPDAVAPPLLAALPLVLAPPLPELVVPELVFGPSLPELVVPELVPAPPSVDSLEPAHPNVASANNPAMSALCFGLVMRRPPKQATYHAQTREIRRVAVSFAPPSGTVWHEAATCDRSRAGPRWAS
jgi:hypothetical protein